MVYTQFCGKKVSRLGMGCMRLPIKRGGWDSNIDYAAAQSIIDYAMSHGVNYYDTAYVYHSGESETFLGEAMKKYPRESFYLATKYYIGGNPDYKATFREQLKKLKTDHIDFYLIHSVMDSSARTYLRNGCIDYFLRAKEQGLIGHLGFSSHASPETLERFASHHAWDFAQIQLNYYDYLFGSAKEEYEILKNKGIPVISMESLRGGRLASLPADAEKLLRASQPLWTTPSWGFRWLKSLDGLRVSLSGMSSLEQIQDNVATYEDDRALNKAETEILFSAASLMRGVMRVPCTACRYCTSGCPERIDIPRVMAAFNRYSLGERREAVAALRALKSGPQDCVSCGACAEHCPQHINVPDVMERLRNAM